FKGILAVSLFSKLFLQEPAVVSVEFVRAFFGVCVVLGHVFNIFLKFKGGKGVATSMGVLIAIAPKAALFGLLVFVAVVIFTRYVSLGSIVAGILMPFYNHFTKQNYCVVILSAILCIIVVATHRSNIKRLIAGRERRVFEKK
ncbi:MAG: glycerol-3-phosphate acyltransferase, partial [Candidatus Omnitrophica bacterium]|nr:glycerol-3-phosphate acyltransferase [Candidatus Omnitrophota bacterium]